MLMLQIVLYLSKLPIKSTLRNYITELHMIDQHIFLSVFEKLVIDPDGYGFLRLWILISQYSKYQKNNSHVIIMPEF